MRLRVVVTALLSAASAAGAQTPALRIHAMRAIDGRGHVLRDVTVVVEGGKIARLVNGSRTRADYELRTLTLLPGLIDAHVHPGWYFNRAGRLHTDNDGDTPAQVMLSAAGNAYTMLLAGITTIQSVGAAEDKDLRDWIAAGTIPGPPI